jgi:site-specific DNA-methyltransferase (adenine-specific)
MHGIAVQDVISDIGPLSAKSRERLGYPTQKPLELLQRILTASTLSGDLVLDPFCGCGTTVHASQKLERQWIGIDITHLAVSLIERRLKDAFPGIAFEVHGTPKDFEGARDLAARDKYQFQWWAVSLVDAVPQGGKKKGMDRGIDGIRWVRTGPRDEFEKVLVSVKGGENVGAAMVRDFKGTIEREGALGGMFVTLAEPTREMTREAAAAGFFETSFGRHPKLQILTIAGLLAGQKPELPAAGMGEGFRKAQRESGLNRQGKLI